MKVTILAVLGLTLIACGGNPPNDPGAYGSESFALRDKSCKDFCNNIMACPAPLSLECGIAVELPFWNKRSCTDFCDATNPSVIAFNDCFGDADPAGPICATCLLHSTCGP